MSNPIICFDDKLHTATEMMAFRPWNKRGNA